MNEHEIDASKTIEYFTKILEMNQLSATQLGKLIGVAHASVGNWIDPLKEIVPSLDNLGKVSKLLRLPLYVVVMQIQFRLDPPAIAQSPDLVNAIDTLANATDEDLKMVAASYDQMGNVGSKLMVNIGKLESTKTDRVKN